MREGKKKWPKIEAERGRWVKKVERADRKMQREGEESDCGFNNKENEKSILREFDVCTETLDRKHLISNPGRGGDKGKSNKRTDNHRARVNTWCNRREASHVADSPKRSKKWERHVIRHVVSEDKKYLMIESQTESVGPEGDNCRMAAEKKWKAEETAQCRRT